MNIPSPISKNKYCKSSFFISLTKKGGRENPLLASEITPILHAMISVVVKTSYELFGY